MLNVVYALAVAVNLWLSVLCRHLPVCYIFFIDMDVCPLPCTVQKSQNALYTRAQLSIMIFLLFPEIYVTCPAAGHQGAIMMF